MSITDELRKFANDRIFYGNGYMELTAIADRIDAEHESAMYDMRREHEEWVAERDANYVKLPVDANNVPIRIGDVIAYKDNTKPKEVVAIMPPSVVMVEDGPRFADMCCHYRKPTVEDVLRGVVTLCHNTWNEDSAHRFYDVDDVMESGNIADFATKLQLRGDAE